MATKPDFAQKLLHDLRLRKQRMAITQNSDMHGNSRQNFNGSKGTKTLEPVGSKIGSTYRSSSNSQKSPATAQTANQIVPYSGDYRSGQVADLSMALSYAFDNRGKLKRLDIASNSAMMNLLKSIGSRSMQQSLNIQWQSTNQFPTLTHLHIDEIAKGAQKLNQILRACSNGINIDEVSVDIGKDLWKGAMELEQSLRMLVSLQEVSESTRSQKNKSRLKLLDENGDSEDDSSVSSGKQKQVERPVFSFDKPSKKTKASVQTDLQQKLKALPYQQGPNSKPERSESMTPKGTHSHRRSASCGPEFQTSQITDSSKSKHNAARLPNVIAKLMGLEELPQNINQKVATESQLSQKRSRELVSVHTAQRSADLKTEYTKNTKIQTEQSKVQSNKITILTTHEIQLQEETYRSTNSHKTTSGLENPRWNEEEREGIKDYVKESKAAIFKINELQSKTIHINQDGESHKDITKEAKLESMKQRQHEVEDVTETMHTYTPDNSNTRKASKTAATKPLIPQQTQNRDVSYEPQGKKLRAVDQSQQREKNNSELRKKEHSAEILQSSRSVARDLKKMQKQQLIKQQNARKKSAEHTGLGDTKASLSYRQIEDPLRDGKDGKFKNLDDKQKSSVSLKADQNDPSTNGQSESHKTEFSASSNVNTKSTHDTTRKVVTDVKPFKIRPVTKTNEVTTKTVTAPRIIAGALRPQKASSHRQKKNKLDKINISRKAPEANERKSKSAESIPGNHKTTKPVCEESQQNIDAEQMDTKNHTHTVRDDPSQRLKGVTKLTPGDEGENTISTITDNQQEQLIANKEEVRLDITATADGQDDTKKNSSNQQQKQQPIKMEKQEPLTEDELFLKQKLIKSHLFLNTAEALFKLNIPISILNYASDQIFEEKNSKIILDCGYELLKRKGRQDIFFYSSINIFMTCKKFRSLDDLVRQLHKDFEALRSYGRNVRGEYDDYDSCVERDIYNKHPDLNCMWDLGWNEVMFPCTKMDEVISTIEQLMLEELVNEVTNDCL